VGSSFEDVALEMTRKCLGLEDDFANGLIVNKVIEIQVWGEKKFDEKYTKMKKLDDDR
jgi:hypothetical protein